MAGLTHLQAYTLTWLAWYETMPNAAKEAKESLVALGDLGLIWLACVALFAAATIVVKTLTA